LKKTPKKKEGSKTSPVLIFFVVFFFLLSVGLGVTAYYGYDGQKQLRDDKKKADDAAKAARQGDEWAQFVALNARAAIGDSLEASESATLSEGNKGFLVDKSKFQSEPKKASIEKFIEKNKEILGWNAADNRYSSTYESRINELRRELNIQLGYVSTAKAETKAAADQLKDQEKNDTNIVRGIQDTIQKNNSNILSQIAQKTKEYEDLQAKFIELQKAKDEVKTDFEKAKGDFRRELTARDKKYNEAFAAKEPFAPVSKAMASEYHPLILDISKGKPLWDNPLGKITRVNLGERTVNINLGDKNGVKPGLTFMIFGAGPDGRADKALKGAIEVIRVYNDNTSLARITAMYDANGKEINLADPALNTPSNQANNPFKEGDLLFNLVWGAHVVVAGNINLAGATSDNPAEQLRTLNDFLQVLRKEGVIVDAYLDPTDGKLKGALTHRTRFLIRGEEFSEGKKTAAKDAEPAELSDRMKQIQETATSLKKEIAERGGLVISAQNYIAIVGYRPSQGANGDTRIGFQPQLPYSGSGLTALTGARNPVPAEVENAP